MHAAPHAVVDLRRQAQDVQYTASVGLSPRAGCTGAIDAGAVSATWGVITLDYSMKL